jgi:hypothetical protein
MYLYCSYFRPWLQNFPIYPYFDRLNIPFL